MNKNKIYDRGSVKTQYFCNRESKTDFTIEESIIGN